MKIKLYRIWAVVVRYLRESSGDIFTIADYVYWPIMDIFMWGTMSVWLSRNSGGSSNFVLVILSGLVFWHIVYQANIEIAKNIVDEFWSQNLVNLFSTPLTVTEWLLAVMTLGAFRMIFTILFGVSVVWLLYSLNIFSIGWALIPFAISLLMTGWFMGITTAGVIIYFGMRAQWLAWAGGWLLAPFSSVFYSIEMLPKWAQMVGYSLPTTYIFEGMRELLLNNVVLYNYLYISFALNIVYLILSVIFFHHMFEKSRERGLARIE